MPHALPVRDRACVQARSFPNDRAAIYWASGLKRGAMATQWRRSSSSSSMRQDRRLEMQLFFRYRRQCRRRNNLLDQPGTGPAEDQAGRSLSLEVFQPNRMFAGFQVNRAIALGELMRAAIIDD